MSTMTASDDDYDNDGDIELSVSWLKKGFSDERKHVICD